jgi:hypothetical protein
MVFFKNIDTIFKALAEEDAASGALEEVSRLSICFFCKRFLACFVGGLIPPD